MTTSTHSHKARTDKGGHVTGKLASLALQSLLLRLAVSEEVRIGLRDHRSHAPRRFAALIVATAESLANVVSSD